MELVWSDGLLEEARRVRDEVAAALDRLGVPGELRLTGAAGMPGVLTKGDVDLHLRVAPSDFDDATTRLAELIEPTRREIWTDTFATFEQASEPPVGVAVTVVGTEHDRRFVRSWERMRAEPELRERYNEIKRRGGDVEAAKSDFFGEVSGGESRTPQQD